MIKFKAPAALLAATLSAVGFASVAQAAPVYQVGSNMAFAPFEFIENGQPAGFDMELIVAIMKTQGVDVKLQNLRFAVKMFLLRTRLRRTGARDVNTPDVLR